MSDRLAYRDVLDEVTRVLTVRLQDAALPLHVLLSSPFGSLNENQEELLTAAQSALEIAEVTVRRLRTLLDLDRGAMAAQPCPIALTELLKPPLAMAEAQGRRRHVMLRADISPVAPRTVVDAMQAQAALAAVLTDAVTRSPVGSEVLVSAGDVALGNVQVVVRYGGARSEHAEHAPLALDLQLARRLIQLQQGDLQVADGQTVVTLPGEVLGSVGR